MAAFAKSWRRHSGEISGARRRYCLLGIGTGTVRCISNELGGAYGRCDPPVGGLLDSENCSCPLSHKRAQKRFLPQKGGGLSAERAFAKKFSGAGEDSDVVAGAQRWPRRSSAILDVRKVMRDYLLRGGAHAGLVGGIVGPGLSGRRRGTVIFCSQRRGSRTWMFSSG